MLGYFLTSKFLRRIDASLSVLFSFPKQDRKRKFNIIFKKLMYWLKEKHVFGKFFIKTLCGTASVNHIQTMRCDNLSAPTGPSAVSPQV